MFGSLGGCFFAALLLMFQVLMNFNIHTYDTALILALDLVSSMAAPGIISVFICSYLYLWHGDKNGPACNWCSIIIRSLCSEGMNEYHSPSLLEQQANLWSPLKTDGSNRLPYWPVGINAPWLCLDVLVEDWHSHLLKPLTRSLSNAIFTLGIPIRSLTSLSVSSQKVRNLVIVWAFLWIKFGCSTRTCLSIWIQWENHGCVQIHPLHQQTR